MATDPIDFPVSATGSLAAPMGAVFMDADGLRVFGQIVAGESDVEVSQSLLEAAMRLTGAGSGAVQCRLGDGFAGPWITDGVTAKTAEQLNRMLDGYAGKSGVQRLDEAHPVLQSIPAGKRPPSVMRALGRSTHDAQLIAMLFGRGSGHVFSQLEATIFDTLVSVASVAASNVAQRDSHRRYEQWMHAIDATAQIMLEGMSARSVLSSVLDAVARRALEVSRADMCAVATPDDDGDSMVLRVAVGRNRQVLTGLSFPERHSLSGTVSRTARQLLVDDATSDARATEIAAQVSLGPVAIAPLVLNGSPLGVMFVGNTRGERPLDRDLAVEAVTVRDLDSWVRAATGHTPTATGGLDDVAARVRDEGRVLTQLPKLSERDLELLGLLAEGLTNGEIGQRLFLAEKTVRNRVSHLLGTLGVGNRVEAAVLMARYSERHRAREQSA